MKAKCRRIAGAIVVTFLLAMADPASAQTFKSVFLFNGYDGQNPQAGLVQGTDGNFYGTTPIGGLGNQSAGTVFQLYATGYLNTIYNFCLQPGCSDGEEPLDALVEDTDQNFYGTTSSGGAFGGGTVFAISPAGTLTSLYNFCAQGTCEEDGSTPSAGLLLGVNRSFYGTTTTGGANGAGTIFKITPQGQLKVLYSFCSLSNCADGSSPAATLVQATNGDFYGVTYMGGAGSACPFTIGCGTVFEMTPSGTLTTLYNLCSMPNCADGSGPNGLTQAANEVFYGTSISGGASGLGTIFSITADGKFKSIYSFCNVSNCADGVAPAASLIQASDGNLYGTASGGGTYGGGTVFSFEPSFGNFEVLHSFCAEGGCFDGRAPIGLLMEATNGTLYGTTVGGGSAACQLGGCGTIFSVSGTLPSFVRALPGAGSVGVEIGILGTDLTGATAVAFNGTPAQFTIESETLILTHVPTGAKTGKIEVTLPSQTLSSNVRFYVLP